MPTPLTVADFVARRPEFGDADQALIQLHLDAAWRRSLMDGGDDLAQDVQSIQAARSLARAPFAKDMLLAQTDKEGSTTYDREWEAIVAELGPAFTRRVAL